MTEARDTGKSPLSTHRTRFWVWIANHLYWLSEAAEHRAYGD